MDTISSLIYTGIVPSLTIAQAILESAWGKSGLSRDCFNYFGMKWKKNCGCDYKEYYTKEQNADGSYVTITAKFRKYKNVEDGIKGYYIFLSGYKRYANLKGVTDATLACELIRKDGYRGIHGRTLSVYEPHFLSRMRFSSLSSHLQQRQSAMLGVQRS